ncbi:hypothetical protein EXW31_05530 [Bacillus mycoides]|nr:hypothetical protein EXW30_05195 [Bacillus mycoides]QWG43788.1 hypothetical protein EXW31_05530 [Bacillus mycoides]QWH10863.1 hypothetical protein EXW38_05590 [Bacillus mycoides]
MSLHSSIAPLPTQRVGYSLIIGSFFNPWTCGDTYVHQANILKYPQNENFIFPELFIIIQLIFFDMGKCQFLKLMAMWRDPTYK